MTPQERDTRRLRLIGRAFAGLMLILGAIGLAGWIWDEPLWRSLWESGSQMKFNTAVCLVVAGGALLLGYAERPLLPRRVSALGSSFVILFGLVILTQYVFNLELGIDELIYKDTNLLGTTHPGRMAAQTALTFVALALGNLLLMSPLPRLGRAGQWCGLLSLFFPVQALIGYALGRMTVIGLGPLSAYMAIPTAGALFCGSVAVLLRAPTSHLMEALTARTQASMVFRRLFFSSILLPPLLGWGALHLAGGRHLPAEYSVATVALATTFLFVALTWLHAARVNRITLSLERREHLLRESDARYRTLFDSIDEGFCVVELLFDKDHPERAVDFQIQEANPAFEKQFGLTSSAQGKRALQILPQLKDYWFELFAKVVRTGRPVRVQNEVSELHRWHDVYAFRVGEPEDRQVAILLTDITAMRLKEEQLRDVNSRLQATLVATEVATWTWDVVNDHVYGDKNLARFFSVSAADAAGGPISKYFASIHPDDRDRVQATIEEAMHSEAIGTFEMDYRLVQPGKTTQPGQSVRWVTARGKVERDAHGRPIRFPGVIIDITERKQAEALLRQNEALFTALVEQAPTGLYVVDSQFRIQQINARALPAFHLIPEPKVGRDFNEVVTTLRGPEVGAEIARIFRHTLETGEPYRAPEYAGRQDESGQERIYDWQVQRVSLPDGTYGVVCYFSDVTEQRLYEDALRKAKTDAELANRSKDRFLAALSHELRTPLNPALLIASESAQNEELPIAARKSFETVRKNIELEARLIDDLLDLTRITSGKMMLDLEPTNVHAVLRDAIATVQADRQEKNIHLRVQFRAQRSMVHGDPVRLQQVFWNLLKNSVKFTPKDQEISVTTHDSAEGQLVIQITDTGIGMSPAELDRIFSAFAQGDHAEEGGSHRFGGLGLGLAISRNIVELHAGTIKATSPGSGHGAVFTVELPLSDEGTAIQHTPLTPAPAPSAEKTIPGRNTGAIPLYRPTDTVVPAAASADPAPPLTILLVEDHEATRHVLKQLLVRRNYRVHTAGNLAEARALAHTEKFDLLISDIGLPDGTGHDLMKELRDTQGLQGIALSGYGMEEDLTRSKTSGFLTHLIKPISIQSLEAALTAFHEAR